MELRVEQDGTSVVVTGYEPLFGPVTFLAGEEWVTPPVACRGQEPLVVKPQLGGFVAAVSRFVPAPGQPELVIAREDGQPLPFVTTAQGPVATVLTEVRPTLGTLLGPLPEGEVRFVSRRGRRSLGVSSVRVVPGRVTLLRIPAE
jgi:hypothetical protein